VESLVLLQHLAHAIHHERHRGSGGRSRQLVPHLLGEVLLGKEGEALARSRHSAEASTCAGDDVQIGVKLVVVVKSASHDVGDE
jgi:hypothetical protein